MELNSREICETERFEKVEKEECNLQRNQTITLPDNEFVYRSVGSIGSYAESQGSYISLQHADSLNLQSPISVLSTSLNESLLSNATPTRKRQRDEPIVSPVRISYFK